MRQIVVEDLLGGCGNGWEQEEKKKILNDKVEHCLDYIKNNVYILIIQI